MRAAARGRRTTVGTAVALSLLLAAGCGYHLTGTQTRVPGGVKSISIGAIENQSRESALGKALALALEREFYRRKVLVVEESPGAGEALLTGTIRKFEARPVAFDPHDEALRYEAELVVDLVLRRQDDGTVLWRTAGMNEVEEYDVAVQIVVPTSSRFQRGTMDPDDLRKLTDIQLAETEKRLAIDRLVDSLVRDVHDRILDDF